jgi:hypothetical protein
MNAHCIAVNKLRTLYPECGNCNGTACAMGRMDLCAPARTERWNAYLENKIDAAIKGLISTRSHYGPGSEQYETASGVYRDTLAQFRDEHSGPAIALRRISHAYYSS